MPDVASQLKVDSPPVQRVQKILVRQIESAIELLGHKKLTDQQIHEARKSLRKARGSLRLLKSAIGPRKFRRENAALRDAARPLSGVRDAEVLQEKLVQLEPRHRHAEPHRERLDQTLRRRRVDSHRALRSTTLRAQRAKLRAAARRCASLNLNGGGGVIRIGFVHTYRQAYRAAHTASSRKTPDLHEWRKQVKYLRAQLRILRPLWPAPLRTLAEQAHHLSDALGNDHDLIVLHDLIRSTCRRADQETGTQRLFAQIERRRETLQNRSFALGMRIFEQKPKQFERRFGKYWKAWKK